MQINQEKDKNAVGVDSNGHAIALINGRGMPSYSDSERAFRNHVKPGSTIIHDDGHFKGAFENCKEIIINSKSQEAKKALNPINRICALVQRLFHVHLRIHHHNRQKYLDEFVMKFYEYKSDCFQEYMSLIHDRIFFSQKIFRRKDISLK